MVCRTGRDAHHRSHGERADPPTYHTRGVIVFESSLVSLGITLLLVVMSVIVLYLLFRGESNAGIAVITASRDQPRYS